MVVCIVFLGISLFGWLCVSTGVFGTKGMIGVRVTGGMEGKHLTYITKYIQEGTVHSTKTELLFKIFCKAFIDRDVKNETLSQFM